MIIIKSNKNNDINYQDNDNKDITNHNYDYADIDNNMTITILQSK